MAEFSLPEQGNPTSQQLNAELRAVLDYVPQNEPIDIFEDPDTTFAASEERQAKRENSAYTAKLRERVANLLQKAPITDYFRQYVLDAFNSRIVAGYISTGKVADKIPEDLFFIEPTTNSDNAGIFDRQTAERIERIALAREMYTTQRHEQKLVKISEKLRKDHEKAVEGAKEAFAPQYAKLNDWREQIRQTYGENVPDTAE